MTKWIIDAGHGGKDSGAIGYGGRREKNISLDAALEAKRVLELNGEEVFLIRSNDIYGSKRKGYCEQLEWRLLH